MSESNMAPKETRPLSEEESRQTILKSARDFSKTLVEKYPQVNQRGRLDYYIGGSLGTMIFLQCDKFQLLDKNKIPDIEIIGEKELTPSAKTHLSKFIRKIGDIDVIGTTDYENATDQMQALSGKSSEEYYKARAKLVISSLKISELSESAGNVLRWYDKDKAQQWSVKVDRVSQPSPPDEVARVNIDNQDFYILSPKELLAYKFEDVARKFEHGNLTKTVNDFESMMDVLLEIYPREELAKAAYEKVIRWSPNTTNIPYHNPDFKGKTKEFFEDVLKIDPNYQYLDGLNFGRERSIGILHILNRLKTPEAKRQVVDFINQHREQLDLWEINFNSPRNIDKMTDLILENPNLVKKIKSIVKIEGEENRQNVRTAVEENRINVFSWFKKEAGDVSFEKMPRESNLWNILSSLKEETLSQELSSVNNLIGLKVNLFILDGIFQSEYITTSPITIRNELLIKLIKAGQKLNTTRFDSLCVGLENLMSLKGYDKDDHWVEVNENDMPPVIDSIFSKYGL